MSNYMDWKNNTLKIIIARQKRQEYRGWIWMDLDWQYSSGFLAGFQPYDLKILVVLAWTYCHLPIFQSQHFWTVRCFCWKSDGSCYFGLDCNKEINGPSFGETKTFTVDLSPVQPNVFLMEQAHHFFFLSECKNRLTILVLIWVLWLRFE